MLNHKIKNANIKIAGILGVTYYGEKLTVLAALFLSLTILVVINFTLKESNKFSSFIAIPGKEIQNVRKVFAFECKNVMRPLILTT
jgi:hypothetical protein